MNMSKSIIAAKIYDRKSLIQKIFDQHENKGCNKSLHNLVFCFKAEYQKKFATQQYNERDRLFKVKKENPGFQSCISKPLEDYEKCSIRDGFYKNNYQMKKIASATSALLISLSIPL